MVRTHLASLPAALGLSLALTTAAMAGSIVLDPLSQPLPANACLPSSQAPVLFLGARCDGASCPPGDVVTDCDGSPLAFQSGLTSLWQDPGLTLCRFTELIRDVDTWSGTAEGVLDPVDHRISVTTSNDGDSFGLALSYGPQFVPDYWHHDFNALGVEAVRVEVEGDVSPERPLWCFVLLNDSSSPFDQAEIEFPITQPGTTDLPLGAFTRTGAFDFSIVSGVSLLFESCPGGCTQPGAARSFAVGPVSFVTSDTPVPARHTTWGRLKAQPR